MTLKRTSLTPYAASMADPDPKGAKKAARQLWQGMGVVTLFPDQLAALSWGDRNMIEVIATQHYGKR